jgi:4-amino-4-deoxy-L-arabinose transferase-like glycosyltransferase
MSSLLNLPKKDSSLLIILSIAYLLTRLIPALIMPLSVDEAVYSIIIEEMAESPTLIPTFLGHPVSWKPPLFFWVDSLFSGLPLPLELAYRLPSLLFGLFSVILTYQLMRSLDISRTTAFFSLMAFIFMLSSVYPDSTVLIDSLMYLLVVGALYLYTRADLGNLRFFMAFMLSFAGFMVKHAVALIIPVLAIAYFLQKDRKALLSLPFLLSLLAIPLAFAAYSLLLDDYGLLEYFFFAESYLRSPGTELPSTIELGYASFVTLFISAGPWLFLSFFGFWKFWRKNLFLTVWYLLAALPLLAAYYRPWYFLPISLPIAYFAVKALLQWDGREKADRFFLIVFALFILISVASLVYFYATLYPTVQPLKEAGLFLAGKENVLIVGYASFEPIAYKLNIERRAGNELDFGWVIMSFDSEDSEALDFIEDYRTEKPMVQDGSFNKIYTDLDHVTFRKETNITEFEHAALILLPGLEVPGGELEYNNSYVQIYRIE